MAHGETSASRPARTGAAQPAETTAVLGAGGMMGFAMARNIARGRDGVICLRVKEKKDAED